MELFCGKKKWNVPDYPVREIQILSKSLGISETCAKLLYKRGIRDTASARRFLSVGESNTLHDPFLLRDMDKAVMRIEEAISNDEKICIYGDYDVDGITSTAVLYNYLRDRGADVSYYIPKRLTEGYGMNCGAIKELYEKGITLIVTVDNGITANAETEYAGTLGIDVVVTDHHECRGELPVCCAVVNPKRPDDSYPFENLAGVGVAFKLICALEGDMEGRRLKAFQDKYIDLVALGTVADVMPVNGENREIISRGLSCFANGSNRGVTALITEASSLKKRGNEKAVTTTTVGFVVAPRLNAAGRIGDVNLAVEILTTEDLEKCFDIAEKLCMINRERQMIENEIFLQAVDMIENSHNFENDKVIVLSAEGWHHGVVGIVASKITEKYGLPSILICSENGVGKGSARSIKGFNINEAIHECRDLLIRHGGHELAAGLTLELKNIDEFRRRLNLHARERLTPEILDGSIDIDAELRGCDIALGLCEELERFEPCGTENPTPVFCMRNVIVREIISLGQNRHTKLSLEHDGCVFDGLLFGVCPDDFTAPIGTAADIIFNLDINEFRGIRSTQMVIREIAPCEDDLLLAKASESLVRDMLLGKVPDKVPTIEKFRAVYKYLRGNEKNLSGNVNICILAKKMTSVMRTNIHPAELGVILKVFHDTGLCELHDSGSMIMHIKLKQTAEKVDLENSPVLKRARNIT